MKKCRIFEDEVFRHNFIKRETAKNTTLSQHTIMLLIKTEKVTSYISNTTHVLSDKKTRENTMSIGCISLEFNTSHTNK